MVTGDWGPGPDGRLSMQTHILDVFGNSDMVRASVARLLVVLFVLQDLVDCL